MYDKIITSEHNQRIKNKGPSRKKECGGKFTKALMRAKYTNDISTSFLAISCWLDEQPHKAKRTDSVFFSFRNGQLMEEHSFCITDTFSGETTIACVEFFTFDVFHKKRCSVHSCALLA